MAHRSTVYSANAVLGERKGCGEAAFATTLIHVIAHGIGWQDGVFAGVVAASFQFVESADER